MYYSTLKKKIKQKEKASRSLKHTNFLAMLPRPIMNACNRIESTDKSVFDAPEEGAKSLNTKRGKAMQTLRS